MIRLVSILILAAFCALLSAQVFPKIEKKEVKKRAGAQHDENEQTKDPDEGEDPSDTERGRKALAWYHKILDNYEDDERQIKKLTTTHSDDFHDSVRKYLEGVYLLKLGYYKDAERLFRDVKYRVEDEPYIKKVAVVTVAGHIKSGGAYYYRAVAEAMRHWDSFKTRKEFDAGWEAAEKAMTEGRDRLSSLADRGMVENAGNWLEAIKVWADEGKEHWLELWKTEQRLEKSPGNLETWLKLVSSTSSYNHRAFREPSPAYLKQRAALMTIKEFWPESDFVMNGQADIKLGTNYVATAQIDDWKTHFQVRDYHNEDGKKLLIATRGRVADYVQAVQAMKVD